MVFTETFYNIRKKNTEHIIITLKKFSNGEHTTKILPMSWDEKYEQTFDREHITNPKTGEIILSHNKEHITYLSTDYEVIMKTEQFDVTDEEQIKQHIKYIIWRQ